MFRCAHKRNAPDSILEIRCKGRGNKNETTAKFAEAAKNLLFVIDMT